MVLCFEKFWGRIPSFSRNAYKRTVRLSGCADAEERCDWLVEHYEDSDLDMDAPMFIEGDLYDETLLVEILDSSDAGFSENAYKRALFHAGNRDAESAIAWLTANADDPLLDSPVNPEGKERRCPKGHALVVAAAAVAAHSSSDTDRCTVGRMSMKSTRRLLGHSLLRSLVLSHRSLIRLLRTARRARALRCAHKFARSLTHFGLMGKWFLSLE